MASIGRMVAGMAHEMNTPIGIAITSSSFLQTLMAQLDEKFRSATLTRDEFATLKDRIAESVSLIHDNLTRSASMIETFKLTGGDIENEIMSTFAIADTIRAAYLAFQKRIESQSVSLITDTGDITLESYPGMFYQIFVILIGNSLTHGFTDHGGTIEITVRRTDETVRIEYRDNGRGIPPEAAGRIYDPFFTTNRARGSTGLGLYVIYNIIVNTLGGRISLDTESQQGVHFSVEIPLESNSALNIPEHVL
jgi:signal transduction histidine kinase